MGKRFLEVGIVTLGSVNSVNNECDEVREVIIVKSK